METFCCLEFVTLGGLTEQLRFLAPEVPDSVSGMSIVGVSRLSLLIDELLEDCDSSKSMLVGDFSPPDLLKKVKFSSGHNYRNLPENQLSHTTQHQ